MYENASVIKKRLAEVIEPFVLNSKKKIGKGDFYLAAGSWDRPQIEERYSNRVSITFNDGNFGVIWIRAKKELPEVRASIARRGDIDSADYEVPAFRSLGAVMWRTKESWRRDWSVSLY